MVRPESHDQDLTSLYGLERQSLRALIRRPAVQLVMIVAATVQGLAAVQKARPEATASMPRMTPVVALAPTPDAAASVEILAAAYREQGFNVPSDLAEEIHEAAVDNGIDPEVAFGLVRAESSFRNTATSTVGAVGLTQLMPATARWLEPGVTRSELNDPETNLKIGFKYLRNLIDKYDGNVDLALVAYNRGPGTVDRALKRGRNPDNGYAAFVRGKKDHGHKLFTH